jgi:hypothetical protein
MSGFSAPAPSSATPTWPRLDRDQVPGPKGFRVNLRYIDWIWHVRGSMPLAPGQSEDQAFENLAPLFHQRNTTHERAGDTLTFRKKDQAAQDKMSVFDGGVLRVEQAATGPVLRYNLVSRALLFCFLAPLLFIAFAQLTIALDSLNKTPTEAAEKAKKPDVVVPLNPIDKMLGAPEPEKPGKDGEKPGRRGKKPSSTPAYVFAGIFATLYLIGRILEARLIRSLFRRSLTGS